MGSRKHNKAEQTKEAKKQVAFASLNNCPTSPRKMRLMADMIRGMNALQALNVLKHSPQDASERLYKLLMSALENWKNKNTDIRMEDANLYIKEIGVDGARSLKRIRTAPQGRAHRIRKRSNHVTLVIDNRTAQINEKETANQVIKTK
ncbi:MAG: 50S ribosomal protein L22 [Bacteroidales bacterium]|nr:50S ribosomal protein L22 [Bacteroidales bacterium]MBK9359330.1 50S ribosomal protein L22 [Bacteroidales bacterium]